MAFVKSHKFQLLGLLVFVLIIYGNAYNNGFLLDDEFLLQKNRYIEDVGYLGQIFTSSSTMGAGGKDSFYRPLQTVAYLVVNQIFGLWEPAFHGLNILLHFLNSCLVLALAATVFRIRPWLAFSAALLWAAHPLHVEAVTYMSATADPLHTLFILASLLSLQRIWLASVFFILALLSKESGVVLLPLAITLLAVQAKKPLDWRTYRKTWPLFLVTIVYLVLRKTILDFDDTFTFYKEPNVYTENIHYRFFTFLATLPKYFGLLLWPSSLHMERDFPVFAGVMAWPVLAGAVILLTAVVLVIRDYKKTIRAGALAALWFFMAHVPHTGVLLPVNSFFLEHWMYLPSIGLTLALFYWLNQKKWNVKWITGATVVAACALGVVTFFQNRVWADPVTFYEHILSQAKGTQRVHNNLGMAYSERGESDRAIEQYVKAVSIQDSYPQVRHNLGEEYMKRGEVQTALTHLHRAVEIDPGFYHSYRNLAAIYQRLGDEQQYTKYYSLYMQTRPQ